MVKDLKKLLGVENLNLNVGKGLKISSLFSLGLGVISSVSCFYLKNDFDSGYNSELVSDLFYSSVLFTLLVPGSLYGLGDRMLGNSRNDYGN